MAKVADLQWSHTSSHLEPETGIVPLIIWKRLAQNFKGVPGLTGLTDELAADGT